VGYNGAPPQPLSGRHIQFTRCHRVNRRAAYNISQLNISLPHGSATNFGLPIPPLPATACMVMRLHIPLARRKAPSKPTSPVSISSWARIPNQAVRRLVLTQVPSVTPYSSLKWYGSTSHNYLTKSTCLEKIHGIPGQSRGSW
jgi:hypothetical protein